MKSTDTVEEANEWNDQEIDCLTWQTIVEGDYVKIEELDFVYLTLVFRGTCLSLSRKHGQFCHVCIFDWGIKLASIDWSVDF